MLRRASDILTPVLAIAAAINVVYLAFVPGYDWRVGPLHLIAHAAFKPLIILSASFTLAILARMAAGTAREAVVEPGEPWLPPWPLLVTVAVIGAYAVSFRIDYHDSFWAYAGFSASHASAGSLAEYFFRRLPDGFYRPVGFLSLWLDWRLFGDALGWYHLQSVGLHLANSLLVAVVGRGLGFKRAVATAAALVFAVAPATFETVMWPAARFDLLAAFFSLAAFALALRYTKEGGATALLAMCCSLTLALFSKESAYAAPLLLIVLRLVRGAGGAASPELRRWRVAILCAFLAAAAAVALRFLVLGGIGGYGSLHFALTWNTVATMLVRAPLACQMAVDATTRWPLWMGAGVAAFALLLVYVAFTYRPGPRRSEWWPLAALLVALLPSANVIAFIGPSLVQGRYLYYCSVWPALFLGAVLMRTPRPRAALALWVALAGLATFFNQYVPERRVDAIPRLVAGIAEDLNAAPSCRQIALVDMPDQMNGSLFFSEELTGALIARLPGVAVDFKGRSTRERPSPSACLAYAWIDETPPLVRLKRIRGEGSHAW
jgi:hypothetical protein